MYWYWFEIEFDGGSDGSGGGGTKVLVLCIGICLKLDTTVSVVVVVVVVVLLYLNLYLYCFETKNYDGRDQGPATLYMSSDAMQKRGKYDNDIHRPKSQGWNLSSEISPLVSFLVNGKQDIWVLKNMF